MTDPTTNVAFLFWMILTLIMGIGFGVLIAIGVKMFVNWINRPSRLLEDIRRSASRNGAYYISKYAKR